VIGFREVDSKRESKRDSQCASGKVREQASGAIRKTKTKSDCGIGEETRLRSENQRRGETDEEELSRVRE
jgi:hypothetical protein